jgi:DNA-binding transcriptional MerR regulator
MALRIGQLADAAGTTAPTIRYYEEVGLLPVADWVGGQRRYREQDVGRLTFIRRCREFGFAIHQIGRLLAISGDRERTCLQARDLAEDHLAAIRRKLVELHAIEDSLTMFMTEADGACSGAAGADCVVLERLAEHPTLLW